MKRVTLYTILVSILISLAPRAQADTVDNFQVRLKGEIVIRETDYRPEVSTLKSLVLTPANIDDTISINYNHCTSQATGRRIVIWHGEEMLFSRSFPDKQAAPLMTLPIKDITGLYNIHENDLSLRMHYYDDQLPADGVTIAYMQVDQPVLPKVTNVPVNRKSVDQSVLEWGVAGCMILVLLIMAYRKFTRRGPDRSRLVNRSNGR